MVDTDYITKESALSCFHDWIDRYGHEHSADEMTEYQRIEDLPVADVRPMVRGKWIPQLTPYAVKNADICACSVCGDSVWIYKDKSHPWNFCPNCGADMRPEGREPNDTDSSDQSQVP